MTATKMKEALEAIKDDVALHPAATARTGLHGLTDEAVALMDWAAGLTDDQLKYLKQGLVLLQHAAEAFRARVAESEITRLADELEALP